ncbi:MAG: hypothetical protein DUD27_06055 [Lachnospiraceae bacterium]|uniref:L,D-transpeptidase family protein n=1 Tax=Candidatus Weimeria bifida TaxID=2599074 RepID=A0A6N7IX33_9FIRM|nr:L,D-transpeptidase family protein [Candidatus Weimeria bifida]RRF96089.1 MAG: hypothetical protein DUD27_06055 [Lachnospiraceae bacterium]
MLKNLKKATAVAMTCLTIIAMPGGSALAAENTPVENTNSNTTVPAAETSTNTENNQTQAAESENTNGGTNAGNTQPQNTTEAQDTSNTQDTTKAQDKNKPQDTTKEQDTAKSQDASNTQDTTKPQDTAKSQSKNNNTASGDSNKGKNGSGDAKEIKVCNTKISAKNVKNKVVLTLSHENAKDKQITGYILYKKNSKGKWVRKATIKKTGKTTYTDKSSNRSGKYVYRVRAYYDNGKKIYYGAYSKSVSITIVIVYTAKFTAKPVKANVKLTLSHKSEKGRKITGYVIYKKKSKGKWVRKATVKKKKKGKTTYTDKKVSRKKKNVYRVRAYYKKGKKTYYGSYTKSKSVSAAFKTVTKVVTDVNSPIYGAKLFNGLKYADGSNVSRNSKYYKKPKFSKYVIYVIKSKQFVTVYGVNGSTYYPVKSFICSPGNATPIGTFHIMAQYRWHELMGPCWGQWCSKIVPGIYFHSIFSSKPNNNRTMSVRAYNNLGTTCSHGCVRVQAGSAKWIYDHCPVGTTVVITNKSGYQPLSKPVIAKIPYWHTWDPTDPYAN